jgi:hypothetical protein
MEEKQSMPNAQRPTLNAQFSRAVTPSGAQSGRSNPLDGKYPIVEAHVVSASAATSSGRSDLGVGRWALSVGRFPLFRA